MKALIVAQGLPDYRCKCGKYRGYKFAGVICDRCGKELEVHGFLFSRRRVRRVNRPKRSGDQKIHGYVLRRRARSVDVADATGTRSRFVLPSAVEVKEGDLVTIVGRARTRKRRSSLVGLGLQRWDPVKGTGRSLLSR